MHALSALGKTPVPFDTTPYHESGARLTRSLRQRSAWGSTIRRLNIDLEKAGRGQKLDWV